MARSPRLLRGLLSPAAPRRSTTLVMTERLGAVTHLTSSLEYLARRGDRDRGGLNNWDILRQEHTGSPPWLLRTLDVVAKRPVTDALHAARVVAAATLLLGPLTRGPRLAANSVLALTSAVLYSRHHYGTDGADQVSLIVAGATTVARAGESRPEVVDASLWFIALQSVLSYTASGWAKMVSSTWRSGQALPGIMRTRAYGDRAAWQAIRRHPRMATAVGGGVLAMECLFPAVFVARGRLARPFVASAATFHLVNGRVMGLGRFLWSFTSMHPAVLYVTGVSDARTGRAADAEPRRDDLMPAAAAGLAAMLATAGLIARARRRRAVVRVRDDECTLRTSAGNILSYRCRGPAGTGPLVVLEAGLMWSPEHFEWLTRELAAQCQTVTYRRAGYGSSRYAVGGEYRLDVSVQDLIDLARHLGEGRPVILAGYSLGGYLCYLAASHLGSRIAGVCLLDPSHPAQLSRSPRQARGSEQLLPTLRRVAGSLQIGWGMLLRSPSWPGRLPVEVRGAAVAEYRDARLWRAAHREWAAAERHFRDFDGKLAAIDAPLLVIAAERTVQAEPVQRELNDEFARLAPRSESHVVSDATHEGILMDAAAARQVAGLMRPFIASSASAATRGE